MVVLMKNFIIGLLVFSLTACGWHLRGSEAANGASAYTNPLNLVITSKDNQQPAPITAHLQHH
jgi:LPS-assembly lipoprotein